MADTNVNIKKLETRISLKYDTYANWATDAGKNLVLLKGEIGICSIDTAAQDSNVVPTVLFKVGDGVHKFYELPWASAKAADVYNWAKASAVELVETALTDGYGAKKLVFKNGNVDENGNVGDYEVPIHYATPEEVNREIKKVTDRVQGLENTVGKDGTGADNLTGAEGLYKVVRQEIKDRKDGDKDLSDLIGKAGDGQGAGATGLHAKVEGVNKDLQDTKDALDKNLAFGDTATSGTIGAQVKANTQDILALDTTLGKDGSGDGNLTNATGLYKVVRQEIANRISSDGTLDKKIDDLIGTAGNGQGTGATGMHKKVEDVNKDLQDTKLDLSEKLAIDGSAPTGSIGAQVKANTSDISGLSTTLGKDGTGADNLTDAAGLYKVVRQEIKDRKAGDQSLSDKIGVAGNGQGTGATGLHAKVEGVNKDLQDTKDAIDKKLAFGDTATSGTIGAQVKANTADISGLSTTLGKDGTGTDNLTGADGLYKVVRQEIKDRKAGDSGLNTRLEKVEAFFKNAADENGKYTGLTDALDTLVEIQDWLTNEEGADTKQYIDRIAAIENNINDNTLNNNTVGSRLKGLEQKVEGIGNDYLKTTDLFIIDCGSATDVIHTPTKEN